MTELDRVERKRTMHGTRWLATLMIAAASGACGPGSHYAALHHDTDTALARAKAGHAEAEVPFQWTLATEYYAAAEAARGRENWPAALKWIKRAKQYATEAAKVTGAPAAPVAPARADDASAPPVGAK